MRQFVVCSGIRFEISFRGRKFHGRSFLLFGKRNYSFSPFSKISKKKYLKLIHWTITYLWSYINLILKETPRFKTKFRNFEPKFGLCIPIKICQPHIFQISISTWFHVLYPQSTSKIICRKSRLICIGRHPCSISILYIFKNIRWCNLMYHF